MIKISKFRFFEYKTVSVVLETVNGNLTVYTALPTDVRLHPTYSKVKLNKFFENLKFSRQKSSSGSLLFE